MFMSSYWSNKDLFEKCRFLGLRVVRISVGKVDVNRRYWTCGELFVDWDMLFKLKRGDVNWTQYENWYWECVLKKLTCRVNISEWLRKWNNSCFVCFCRDSSRCHRSIVGRWINWLCNVYDDEFRYVGEVE